MAQSTTKSHRELPVIVSLGPQTDAILDWLKLDDSLIPDLRDMARTIRSSRWEDMLRSPAWGLSHRQAANLSKAILADVQANPTSKVSLLLCGTSET